MKTVTKLENNLWSMSTSNVSFFIVIALMLGLVVNMFSFSLVQAASISIDDAINIAINNSMQCEIDDLNIVIKEEALKQANENAAFLGDAFGAQKILNNKIIKEVRTFEAETNVEVAKKTKEDNISNLKVNIQKAVQGLLIAQIELAIENNRLDIMLERYNLLESKLKQELITENDLVDIEYSIENKRIDIVKVGEKIESIKNDIKKLLNIPFSSDLMKIDTDIKFELLKHIDENKAVSNALSNSTSIYKLTKDVEAKQKVLGLTGQYFSASDISYISAKYALEQVKASLEDTKLSLEVSVKNSYSNLLNQRDRVYLAEKYFGIVSKKFDLAQVKYKNGMLTTDALLSAKEALINAEYQRYNTIYSYNLSKIDFEAKIR